MASVKHLGTENNLRILKSMYDYLVEKINIKCNTSVESISVNPDGTFNLQLSDGETVTCKYLIASLADQARNGLLPRQRNWE